MSLRRDYPGRTVWLRSSGHHHSATSPCSAADVDRPPASDVMTSSLAIIGLAPVGSRSHGHRVSATPRGHWAGRHSGDSHYGGRVVVGGPQLVDAWAQLRPPTLDGADGDGWSSDTSSGCGSLTPHPSPACASPPAPTTSSRLFSLRPPTSPSCDHAGTSLAMHSLLLSCHGRMPFDKCTLGRVRLCWAAAALPTGASEALRGSREVPT